jgi:hypothetical protein
MPSLPGVAQPPAQLKGLAHAGASVWRVVAGCYGVMVGSSLRDLPLRALLAEGGARCTRRGAGRAL